jgi:hypothetical protein
MAEDLDGTGIRRDRAETHEQCCRLSGTIRPEQSDPLPRRDGEVHAVDGAPTLVVLNQTVRS